MVPTVVTYEGRQWIIDRDPPLVADPPPVVAGPGDGYLHIPDLQDCTRLLALVLGAELDGCDKTALFTMGLSERDGLAWHSLLSGGYVRTYCPPASGPWSPFVWATVHVTDRGRAYLMSVLASIAAKAAEAEHKEAR